MFNNVQCLKKVEPNNQMECSLGMKMVSRQAVLNEKRRSQCGIEKHYNSVNLKYMCT